MAFISMLVLLIVAPVIAGEGPSTQSGTSGGIVDNTYNPISYAGGATDNIAMVDVREYGAKGDGVNDDTAAIQSALAANRKIVFPPGNYIISGNGLDLNDNVAIIGLGLPTLKSSSGYIMSVNRGTGGTPDPADNKKNVVIDGIRFEHAGGFSEQVHQLNINAASNILVQNCTFYAFKGDGIYVGSSNAPVTERHNRNITIRKNIFDGYKKDNRQGISIIDGSDITIDDNYFVNTTKSDMPGAIALEPDANSFSIIKNIIITNNKIFNSGHNGIVMWIPVNLTIPISNIRIEGNHIDNCVGAGIYVYSSNDPTALTQASASFGVIVANNLVKNCGNPLVMAGLKGAIFTGNTFTDSTDKIILGGAAGYDREKSFDISFNNNHVARVGTDNGFSVWINQITNLEMIGNTFTDCGNNTARGSCIDFSPVFPAAISNIRFTDNKFYKSAITNMKATSQSGAGTITYTYNNVFNNYFHSLSSIFLDEKKTP